MKWLPKSRSVRSPRICAIGCGEDRGKMFLFPGSTRIMRSQSPPLNFRRATAEAQPLFSPGISKNSRHQQDGSNHNRAVGKVERRPMMIADVEIQKVSHRSLPQPVPEIAECSAQNQAERNGNQAQSVSAFPEQIANHRACHNRKADQTCCAPGRAGISKDAECCARVLPMREPEQTWNNGNLMRHRNTTDDQQLRDAVQQNHCCGNQDLIFSHCLKVSCGRKISSSLPKSQNALAPASPETGCSLL